MSTGNPDTSSIAYTGEQMVQANGIQICYDAFGDPTDPPMLLIMGLGAQMTAWAEPFCTRLAAKGLWVIRYDNRDSGCSTHLEEAGAPGLWELALMALGLARGRAPYLLTDMAADAVGLMDALDIARAHVAGVSMGGMIAQTLGIHHGSRLRTITSIMSSPGGLRWPLPSPRALSALLAPPAKDLEEQVANAVEIVRAMSGPGYPIPEEAIRQWAAEGYARAPEREGSATRQFAAVLASGSRIKALAAIQAPTLVIHGQADPLLLVAHGAATAAAIPGARLLTIERMGHFIPEAVAPRIVDAVAEHALTYG